MKREEKREEEREKEREEEREEWRMIITTESFNDYVTTAATDSVTTALYYSKTL